MKINKLTLKHRGFWIIATGVIILAISILLAEIKGGLTLTIERDGGVNSVFFIFIYLMALILEFGSPIGIPIGILLVIIGIILYAISIKPIRRNWDIILLYLPLIIGFSLTYWSTYETRGVTNEAAMFPLIIFLYTIFIVSFTIPLFSIVTIVRTFKRKMNKWRILWIFPIIVFYLSWLLYLVVMN